MCKKLAKNARIFGIWDKAQMGEGGSPTILTIVDKSVVLVHYTLPVW